MSFLSGLWNKPAPTPATAPAPAVAPGTGGPVTKQDPANPPNPTAALDSLMGLMTPKQPSGQQQKSDEPFTVFGKVDPVQIHDQVSKASFIQGMDPELAQKALAGDANALMDMMNGVAQNVFKANMQLSQQFVEHGVGRGNEHLTSQLDSHFRQYQLRNQNISTQNPALQHPVGKAMVQTFAQQIANANPGMTPDEVQRQAETGVVEFMKIGGAPQVSPSSSTAGSGKKDTNWLTYLD